MQQVDEISKWTLGKKVGLLLNGVGRGAKQRPLELGRGGREGDGGEKKERKRLL